MSLKSFFRTRLSAAIMAPAMILGVTACMTTEPNTPSGEFLVLNANPQVTGLQLEIDGGGPFFTSQIPFGSYCCGTPFLVAERSTAIPFQFSSGSSSATIASENIRVHRDSVYFLTVFRDRVNSSLSDLLVLKNSTEDAAATANKFRFIHIAPAIASSGVIENIDVYLTAANVDLATVPPNISNLAYGDTIDHITFTRPTDTLRVRITRVNEKTLIHANLDKKYLMQPNTSSNNLVYLPPGIAVTAFVMNGTGSTSFRLFEIPGF